MVFAQTTARQSEITVPHSALSQSDMARVVSQPQSPPRGRLILLPARVWVGVSCVVRLEARCRSLQSTHCHRVGAVSVDVGA